MRSEWSKEHVFARLVICPGLFEQLGLIQQYRKLCRAESKTDICLMGGHHLTQVKKSLFFFFFY